MGEDLQVGSISYPADYVSRYVDIRRRAEGASVKKLGPLCCVRHCSEHASYTHNTTFGGLQVKLDLCTKHHKEVS